MMGRTGRFLAPGALACVYFAGPSWADAISVWPRGLPAASAMFQCGAAQPTRGRDSLVVWVNSRKRLVAIDSAREDWPLPAYARHMIKPTASDPIDSIKATRPGYVIRTHPAGNSHQLQIGALLLHCVATFDD